MSKQPNIVLVVMDSVRAGNLSCYGYHRPTTPHLDALAQESTLYEQAISVGCWTLPVHASLFTGLYPSSHAVTVSRNALSPGYPTLAARLGGLGYQTACFSNNAYISSATGLTAGFDHVEDLWRTSRPRGFRRSRASRLVARLEACGAAARPAVRLVRVAQRARAALKRRGGERDSGAQRTNERIEGWVSERRDARRPSFLFVNYMECHEPYSPPSPYDARFVPSRFSPWRAARLGTKQDVLERLARGAADDDLEILQGLYDGELSYLDQRVGELVRLLQRRGMLEDSLLIVTSDHGDSLGEHRELGHRLSLYEPLVHVPLLVRYPERFRPGARVQNQVPLIDLYPTILEVAGGGAGNSPARSLLDPEPRRFTIAENTAPKSCGNVLARMLRSERYKYIWKSNGEDELYDLESDRAESTNLAATQPELVGQFQVELESWRRSLEQPPVETAEADYDDAIRARLRDLGYVD